MFIVGIVANIKFINLLVLSNVPNSKKLES